MGTFNKNWAGNVKFTQNIVEFPSSENEIQKLIIKAANDGRKIRSIGSGHSFSKLCQTDSILLSLDKYQGIVSVDKENNIVTVKGGTKLKTLGVLLYNEGLAMENMGDIDSQSIAGTISTGTHGTGVKFGTISDQVVGLKFINGKGEIISCSLTDKPELFRAVQVSLGAMGIITEVTLKCVPSYKLLTHNRKEKLEDVLSSIDQRNTENRNFEFFWVPYTEYVWTKTTNVIEEGEPKKDNLLNYLSDLFIENYVFLGISEMAKLFPSLTELVSKITAANIPTMTKINYSHKVYASLRLVKFTEMEYNIPQEAFVNAMKDVKKLIEKKKYRVHFPIENRWVRKDEIMMSPAYGRDSAYVACHMYHKKDSKTYFKELEEIFRAYGGRPHWGKQNNLTLKDVEELYPMFPIFNKYRKEHDPANVFTSKYMQKLIG